MLAGVEGRWSTWQKKPLEISNECLFSLLDTDFHKTSLEHLNHTHSLPICVVWVLPQAKGFLQANIPCCHVAIKTGKTPQLYLAHHVFAVRRCIIGSFPAGKPTCQCRRCRDMGLIPGLGRSGGSGHGNPLQYSCLENLMDRGACSQGCEESDTTETT